MIKSLWESAIELFVRQINTQRPISALLQTYIRQSVARGCLANLSNNEKNAFFEEISAIISDIQSASDPLLHNRRQLGLTLNRLSRYHVLALNAETKTQSSLQNNKQISGELHQHLRKIFICDNILQRGLPCIDDCSHQFLLNVVNERHEKEKLKLLVSLTIRNLLGDFPANTRGLPDDSCDWFIPWFEVSAAAWEEYHRNSIGLPGLLADNNEYGMGTAAFIAYTALTDMVIAGKGDPIRAWKRKCRELKAMDPGTDELAG